MQQEHYDVLIVGAGVVGCSIAYHLGSLDCEWLLSSGER
jgi:Predicted dehydrogenase